MKICSKEMAAIVYGAGSPSGFTSSFASPAPQVSSTISSAPSFSSSSSGSNNNTSSGGFMSFLGNLTGTDSGVTNGKRDDGLPLGTGCGDKYTDGITPDRIFGKDITKICINHDNETATLGFSKEIADKNLRDGIYHEMGGGVTAAVVSNVYYGAVTLFGGPAYDRAQQEARDSGTRGSSDGGGVATGGNGGDASGGGDRGTRGGF
jgi:hypothetical protein